MHPDEGELTFLGAQEYAANPDAACILHAPRILDTFDASAVVVVWPLCALKERGLQFNTVGNDARLTGTLGCLTMLLFYSG